MDRRRRARAGTFAGATLAFASMLSGCIPMTGECLGGQERSDSATQLPVSVTLDAAHPAAEQSITIHANSEALPVDHVADFRLQVVLPRRDPKASSSPLPGSTPAASGPGAPDAAVPEVTIVRDDTNTTVAVTTPNQRRVDEWTSIPIDCRPGEACDRTYRIRVAAPGLHGTETLSFSWWAITRIRYEGIAEGCGIPEDVNLDTSGSDPQPIPADEVAFTPAIEAEETGGALYARHVTVTSTDPEPIGASLRLSILQASKKPDDTSWMPWIRVVADGSAVPLADDRVGGPPPDQIPEWDPATLDIPILGDCAGTAPCRRGYWIVFQNVPAGPAWPDAMADPSPTLGQLRWTIAGTATHPIRSGVSDSLQAVIDDLHGALAPDPVVDASPAPITIEANDSTTDIDAEITFPSRPTVRNGLDPLATTLVLVHNESHGGALTTEVTGPGTHDQTGYANGDGSGNFVAHPLDGCPASDPCTVRLRLSASAAAASSNGRQSTDLQWRVTVVGAPGGTTIRFLGP